MFEQSFGKSYLSPTVVAPKLTENPTSSRHHSVLSLPPEGELRRDGIQLQCVHTHTQEVVESRRRRARCAATEAAIL